MRRPEQRCLVILFVSGSDIAFFGSIAGAKRVQFGPVLVETGFDLGGGLGRYSSFVVGEGAGYCVQSASMSNCGRPAALLSEIRIITCWALRCSPSTVSLRSLPVAPNAEVSIPFPFSVSSS